MVNSSAALRHHGFVYESDDEYVERSAAFLRDGLEAGEACIVSNTRDGLAIMRDALGPDADRVAFVDVSPVYTRPARAVATYYGTFCEQLRSAPSVRAVANGQFGPSPEDWEEWTRYEAITNLAYAHLPVWVVCAYDANKLPDPLIEAVQQTHPEMLGDGWQASDHYEDPRELIQKLTPEPEPLPELRCVLAGRGPRALPRTAGAGAGSARECPKPRRSTCSWRAPRSRRTRCSSAGVSSRFA